MLVLLAAVATMLLLMGAGIPDDSMIEAAAASDSAAALDMMEAAALEETEEQDGFLFVDGTAVEVNYTIYDGSTYVSVVDFAKALAPEAYVTWTGSGVVVNTEKLTLTAEMNADYAVANGRYLYLKHGLMIHNGSAMLPLTVLAKAFDAQVVWNSETATIDLTTGSGALMSGDSFYDTDDLYWLSRIIHAESGNQPMSGKIAVGNVIMNRVESNHFPDTVYSVIFQKNQFSPARSGSVNKAPSEESVIAAKLVMDGAEALDGVLYFNQTGLNCWAARNKALIATIGNHSFYR